MTSVTFSFPLRASIEVSAFSELRLLRRVNEWCRLIISCSTWPFLFTAIGLHITLSSRRSGSRSGSILKQKITNLKYLAETKCASVYLSSCVEFLHSERGNNTQYGSGRLRSRSLLNSTCVILLRKWKMEPCHISKVTFKVPQKYDSHF